MKSSTPSRKERLRWYWAAIAGACAAVSSLPAADTNAPAPATPPPLTPQQFFEGGDTSYDDWVEFSTGGFLTQGNKPQFQQDYHNTGGVFGGISDLHYQRDLAK